MRRTVGSKRGSVRDAGPELYLPFGSYHEDEEPWNEGIQIFKSLFVGGTILVVIYTLFELAFYAWTTPE